MNKNVRHLIAAALVISAFSAVAPANIFNLGVIEANASTYSGASNGQLKSLSVYRSTGKEAQLYSNLAATKETELTSSTDYYIDLKGSDGVELDAEVEGDDYVVKVFKSSDKDAEGYDPSDLGLVPIDSGSTNLYLRTYRSEDDYKDASDDGNVKKCVKTYTLHISKDSVNSDEEDDTEYPYLSSIYLSDGSMNFTKNKTSYKVNVDEDVKELLVRAKPEDDDDLVEINGDSVDEDGNYEKKVSLDKGENTIKITVENDDETTTYNIVVNRGGKSSDSSNSSDEKDSTNIITGSDSFLYNSGTMNSWVSKNGKYMYMDGTGQPLKNKWWFDVSSASDYYFDKDGYAQTGWAQINGKWYYFDNSGKMQKGWISNDGKWYYLNVSGAMVTGWYQDAGKWYYLNSDGSMKTGWLNDNGSWYLFNSDGSMVTGNVLVDGVQYSFASNGVMI
ncbi:N-acetylmuramoyl-L-alanine amidase family protein [Clostridium butyricum]|uniref:N-acetylmuramoyl-L-alanine amidase family protein n=2 Tax=Clostridium butyricum TaxID=1492 RepID=UPI00071BB47A|nr:cadherin-like beta sandwich domain-containing protein [Clostridium butyricum]ALP91708.1 collagenolytic protease [Clostridium butyricum]ALS18205.1 collagenolytic protease [Clostridium butyricum]ANF15328.1 collagenolytic protease [Clostridium butyricum]AOR95277.1 collagenolytic protease [Clostridium butyricum]MCI3009566.1 cadherin-like beta sandwich domain-containing protein [Clostridium butyricum]